MHGYNVHEVLNYLNRKMVPETGAQALGWGQYGHILKVEAFYFRGGGGVDKDGHILNM